MTIGGTPLMGRSLVAVLRMSPDLRARLHLLAVYLVLLLRGLLRRGPFSEPVSITVSIGGQRRNWWVRDAGEIGAFWEIFAERHYDDYLPATASTVLDIGANTGVAAARFRLMYPNALIVCVEPNRQALDQLERNLAVSDDSRIVLVNAAVGGAAGDAYLVSNGSSLVGQVNVDRIEESSRVPMVTIQQVVEAHTSNGPPDLIKVDIEGSEWAVMEQGLPEARAYVFEIHEPAPGGKGAEAWVGEFAASNRWTLGTTSFDHIRWLLPDRS